MKTKTDSDLHAPDIPVAEVDGLIKLSDLTNDVAMYFPVWEGARPRDAYQVAFNGQAVGERIPLPDPVPEGQLSLTIPLFLLQTEGSHQIAVQVTTYPGGNVFNSPATIIRIDLTAPGAALLAPLIFSQINVGEILPAHIPGYAGMSLGDTVQTLCNGIQGPMHVVSSDDLSTQPMQIGFSREFLQSLNSSRIEFSYQVTDRAGNRSPLAWPATLTMSG